MKRTLYFAAVALAMILIAPTIYGQSDQPKLRFHIPFQFSINSETFTPGDYVVIQKSTFLLKVANLNSSSAAFESVYPAQSRKEANGQVRLIFHRYGNQYFLATVSDGSWQSTYDFRTSTDEKHLAQMNAPKPMMTVSVSPEGTVLVAAANRN